MNCVSLPLRSRRRLSLSSNYFSLSHSCPKRATRSSSSNSAQCHHNSDALDQILRLPTGRQIGYSIYGDSSSSFKHNIIYLHGLPGSRVEARDLSQSALYHKARLIALDRPGYGLSSLHSNSSRTGHSISNFPITDVIELINHLQINEFYVVGVSGGGPYALSCARHLTHDRYKRRLKGTAVIAGLSPFKHQFPFFLSSSSSGNTASNNTNEEDAKARLQNRQKRILQRYMFRYLPNFTAQLSDSKYGKLARQRSSVDGKNNTEALRSLFREGFSNYRGINSQIFKSEDYIISLSDLLSEAFKQGWKGYANDGKLLHRHWNFNLNEIEHDNVLFAYGGLDDDIPPEMGREMSRLVKGSRFVEYDTETHASLIREKGREIIGDLLNYKK